MDYLKIGFISSVLIMSIYNAEAQNYRESLKEDRKKILLDQVKPPMETFKSPREIKKTLDIAVDKKKYLGNPQGLTGGAMFDDRYTIGSSLSNIDIKKLVKPKFGEETKVMIVNGRYALVPVKDYERVLDRLSLKDKLRTKGIMISAGFGGLNLSGFKEKKLSEKSKQILKDVFDIDVEEGN